MTKGIEIKRQASIRLSSLLFCLVIFVLSAELGLAQDRTLPLEKSDQDASRFRVERLTVGNGGELLTIWGRVVDGSETASSIGSSQAGAPIQTEEIPLLSVLRDTLGDEVEENVTGTWSKAADSGEIDLKITGGQTGGGAQGSGQLFLRPDAKSMDRLTIEGVSSAVKRKIRLEFVAD